MDELSGLSPAEFGHLDVPSAAILRDWAAILRDWGAILRDIVDKLIFGGS